MARIRNDEPSRDDLLGRDTYVVALAEVIRTCDTPMTLGVFGTWGTGKTSLMRQIQGVLDNEPTVGEAPLEDQGEDILTVWFDPWMHQFDENPVVALVQSIVEQLGLERSETVKKLLAVIGMGLVDSAASLLGTFDVDTARSYVNWIEDEKFARRDVQVRLREEFERFIRQAQTKGRKHWWRAADAVAAEERRRLVVFIDDLDRCTPDKVIDLLEGLKLFMNVESCVYVLGLDRDPIDAAIAHRYDWVSTSQARYLDKIIQLPFWLPPIPADARKRYAHSMLEDLQAERGSRVVDILAAGVGANPRQAKRFANTFTLSHVLCSATIENYSPAVLAVVLLIQYRYPTLYAILARTPSRFAELWTVEDGAAGSESKRDAATDRPATLRDEYVAPDAEFGDALDASGLTGTEQVGSYIALTDLSSGTQANGDGLPAILEAHLLWLRTQGNEGVCADLHDRDLRGADLQTLDLRKANLASADLKGANLTRADLRESNLSMANLRRAQLRGAELDDAVLSEANLGHAVLVEAGLARANLAGAILTAAALRRARMIQADLSGADLSHADLTGADLRSVVLTQAQLGEAKLGSADLRAADLRGADLADADLRLVVHDELTQWPDGFEPPRSARADDVRQRW